MKIIERITQRLAYCLAMAALIAAPYAMAAFDPVNDDTDIFLANPNIDAQRPNVLIILDSTANWSRNVAGQAIVINETAALSSVVANLSDQFNVGLMMYAETGGSNDNIDGGYIRSHIRQMTTTNKTVLSSIVSNLDDNGDKGNNNTISLAMLEAYRYFSGNTNRASHGKEKTDYASNTGFPHPATTAGLSGFALPASPTASSVYNSPIIDGCAKNFIIYISNGTSNENADALSVSDTELTSLGYDTTTTISISPNGQEGNWMDEWADYMANADIYTKNVDSNGNGTLDSEGIQTVTTYVVEVDPQTTGQNDDTTALMKSVASKGNGEYFAVTSANGGQSIVNALNKIFTEIQAVNSVFASTTLPVSVNVRGTNLNQVYIGVFRPDSVKSPRWFGNLKMYNLAFDSVTSSLFLADAQGNSAENPVTGFINANSPSFWTSASTFWSYRSANENGPGGSSDSPDGDLVEKGGAAQQLRNAYAASQAARKMYTCNGACTAGSSLSATPFATTNTNITSGALGLGTVAVSNLTAFDTQNVTKITDAISVDALSTFSTGFWANLNNGAVNKTVTALSGQQTKSLTSVTNDASIITLTNLVNGSGATKKTVTATAIGHPFLVGDTVTITGSTVSDFNGAVTISSTTANSFVYTSPGNPTNNTVDSSGSASITTTSTIVTANLVNHGFIDGQSITIAGVVPTDYNGTYTISAIGANAADEFSFVVSSGLSPISSDAAATATGDTTTASATVAAHGYADGTVVTIDGADNPDFNGAFTISLIDANTFSYDLTENGGARAGVTTGTIAASQGSTTVTVDTFGNQTRTISASHGFIVGQAITIQGASPTGYNGAATVVSVADADTFTFTSAMPLPANTGDATVTSGTSTTAVISIPNHGLGANGTNVNIIIEGVTNEASYNRSVSAFIPDSGTLTYSTAPDAPPPAIGNITVRRNTALITPEVTIPGHGYNTGDIVTILNADNPIYNKVDASITVIDANRFIYTTTTANPAGGGATFNGLGDDTSNTITSNEKTTTAKARVINHGFTTGNNIGISGATPSTFNGTFTITVSDANNFIYTLASPEGDGLGSIVASGGAATGGNDIINWVRGADNLEDEDGDSLTTDIRPSIHGDVLHSRPAVINYNRHGANFPNGPDGDALTTDDNNTTNDDVYVFYGGNDGVFRAVKGGFNQSDVSEPLPGNEAWSFVMEEHFPDLQRLRNNAPTISSSNKKPYFADGTIGTFTDDADGDGKLQNSNAACTAVFPKQRQLAGPDAMLDTGDDIFCDRVYIYISMRRGGRFIYGLDVTNPADPKLLWKKSNLDTGFSELGFTFSAPRVTTINVDVTDGILGPNDSPTPLDNPVEKLVLMFGAGYDPDVDDLDPATITAVNAATGNPTANAAVYPRTMGRGIFVLDAETGDIIWQAGPPGPTPSHTYVSVAEMDYAIPSDMSVITGRSGGADNRAYVGDTGGNMWRFDFAESSVANWKITRLASISSFTADADGKLPGNRKFLFPPDVVRSEGGFDAILIGSGDREHPFDILVQNRFYMFKDIGIETTPLIDTTVDDSSGTTTVSGQQATLAETDLFDASSNCFQELTAAACAEVGLDPLVDDVADIFTSQFGWYIDMAPGEKSVGNAVTLNSVTFFNTNQPSSVAQTSSCGSDLGVARQYQIRFDNASAILDQNVSGGLDAGDRSTIAAGGGYLPSPVPVVVEIDGEIYEGVISGTQVDQPPGTTLNARTRKFWFKDID